MPELLKDLLLLLLWGTVAFIAVLTPYTLYRVATNDRLNKDDKVMWLVVVFLMNLVGAILYWSMAHKPDAKE